MSKHAWMPWTLVALLIVLSTTACSEHMPAPFWKKDRTAKSDPDAPFDPPNTYHEWAYDAPQYMKPAQELTPEPKVKPGDPLHYFTKDKVVMIRRPEGYTPEETPRVAIWWTDNNGFHWNKAGYFGRQQSFFPFEVKDDGDYGIRFVGPGQEPALHSLPLPERVYHVDTALPEVEVTIEPEQSWYHVGDTVTISWKASDYHLIEYPVRVGMLTDFTGDDQQAVELQRDLADEGSITYTLPQETLDHEIRFRVDALDRAANLGIAISFALQVVANTPEGELGGDSNTGDPMTTDDETTPPPVAKTDEPVAPNTMKQNTQSSVVRTRANAVPSDSDSTVPFATAAARATDFTPAAAPTAAPVYADGPEPIGGAFTLPDSLTNVPGTHLTPTEVVEAPTASPDGDGLHQKYDVEPMQPIDAAPAVHPNEPSREPPNDPSASAAPQRDPLVEAMAQSRSSDLLIPMPATVEQPSSVEMVACAHPWRSLTGTWPTVIQTVWNLPRPNFGAELNRLFDIGTLASNTLSHPVAEPPPQPEHAMAKLSDDDPTP